MRFSIRLLRLDDAAFTLHRTPHRIKPQSLYHQQGGRKHRVGHLIETDDGWREVIIKGISVLDCPPGTTDADVLVQLATRLRRAREHYFAHVVPTRYAQDVYTALAHLTYPRST